MKKIIYYCLGPAIFSLTGCTLPQEHYLESMQMQPPATVSKGGEKNPVFGQEKVAVNSLQRVPDLEPLGTVGSLPYWIDRAMQNNPDTRRSWALARVAAARKGLAESTYYPSVDVSAKAVHSKVGATRTTPQVIGTSYIPAVEINYKLFQFGADEANADAARQTLYATYWQHVWKQQEVLFNVQEAYYQLHQAEAMVEAQNDNQKDAQATYDAALKRQDAGLTSNQDVLRAKANLLDATYALENAHAEVESARANLAKCVGVPVSTEVRIGSMNLPQKLQSLDYDVQTLMSTALKSRSDVLAARSTLQAAEKTERSKQLSFLPEVHASAGADWTKYNGSSGRQKNYNGAVLLKWNLFDGFSSTYALLEARADKEAKRQELKKQEIVAVSEVWTAYYAFRSSIRQLDYARAFEEASQETFKAVHTGYGAGVNSILDVLSEQNKLAKARLNKIKAETQISISLAKLAYKSGSLPN